jgi:hypothetical protein
MKDYVDNYFFIIILMICTEYMCQEVGIINDKVQI